MLTRRFDTIRASFSAAFSIPAPIHKKLANAVLAARWRHLTMKYINAIGEAPNYIDPASYTEKIQCRKLWDHNPLFPTFCDKLEARAFAKTVCDGLKFAEIYWCGEDPEQVPFDQLPIPYIIKPNHCSGEKYVVRDKRQENRSEIRRLCYEWLKTSYGQGQAEWGYHDVHPRIYAEELLPAPKGLPFPDDYKFAVFSGKVEDIRHVRSTDQEGTFYMTYFDRNWMRLSRRHWCGWKKDKDRAISSLKKIPPPKRLDRMIEIAECLAGDVDYLRVDLYEIDGEIYFGELTPYEGSGFVYPFPEEAEFVSYPPRHLDYQYGAKWKQPPMPITEKLWRAVKKAANF